MAKKQGKTKTVRRKTAVKGIASMFGGLTGRASKRTQGRNKRMKKMLDNL